MPENIDINRLFSTASPGGNDIHINIPEEQFQTSMETIAGKDIILIGLFCVQDFDGYKGFHLLYVFEKRNYQPIVIIKRRLKGNTASSVAVIFPSATWFEREISDGFGIEFPDAFDRRHLFLHEIYPESFHPLRKEFTNQPVRTRQEILPVDEYQFKEMAGEGIYQIPVGPVHAGIIEPGHFRFSVIGETIFNLELRMFYKHRGIEKLAEGKTPAQGVVIAETISGDESVANAVAYSIAIEKICEAEVPLRALYLRTLLLEMERLYSHLGDMAGMVVDVAFPRGAAPFFNLREEILRQNLALTGSRFSKGIICPGGLAGDISAGNLIAISDYLTDFVPRFQSNVDLVSSNSSVIDRLETTGIIKPDIINYLNVTGPAARASGARIDTRFDHPYGAYTAADNQKRTEEKGDVLARFKVKSQEILDSVASIHGAIANMTEGEILAKFRVQDGFALSLVESPADKICTGYILKMG